MPNQALQAADLGLPLEPAFVPTDAGRAYLLLQDILDRLHIEGGTAAFEITPAIAAELAAFNQD